MKKWYPEMVDGGLWIDFVMAAPPMKESLSFSTNTIEMPNQYLYV